MPKFTVTVEGLSDLADALQELPKATSTNVLKRALTNGAAPIQSAAASLAPVLTGTLQQSITIGTKLSRRQKSLSRKESKVEVFIGPDALPQAITAEFGTSHSRARPYMRPAWDGQKKTALEIIANTLGDEIEKARARIARKQARLLAQMKK